MGIFWQLVLLSYIYREKNQLFISSWRARTVFLDGLFVKLMLNADGHALSKTARKFLCCEELSFLGTLRADNTHHSPLTYRQTQPPFTFNIPHISSHLSPKSLTQVISQAHNDFPALADPQNTLSSTSSSNLNEIQVYRICIMNHSLQVKNNLRGFFPNKGAFQTYQLAMILESCLRTLEAFHF